jgi:KaiC/GvpD/RAD55 family RecA-like ATPase
MRRPDILPFKELVVFDAKIVSACVASRAAYNRIKSHIDPKEFTPTGNFWWGHVEAWYDADPSADRVDAALLRDRGLRSAGRNAPMAGDWFDSLPEAPSPDNVAWEVLELKRIVKWRELAAAMEAEWDRPKILELADEHAELMRATELGTSKADYGVDLDELDQAVSAENRIRLWPEKLQAKTGGAMPGHHIVVFGRPESGKTLFSVNMAAGWLRDGQTVLYVGNEDNINLIKDRIRWNLAGMTREQILKFPEEANSRCRRKGWDKLTAVHLYPGSAHEIDEIADEIGATCLVIDQLRNLHTADAKGGTKAQRLDSIAIDVRQLLARRRLVGVSVGQANAGQHGEPKLWLEMDDFDESRTGVPGSADLMCGVGSDQEHDRHNQRAISLPKNKMSGDHEGFIVNIDKYRSKIQ